MRDDIPTLLREAAADPQGSPDFEAMAARGRRQRLIGRVGLALVAVIVVVAGSLWMLPGSRPGEPPIIGDGSTTGSERDGSGSLPDGWHEIRVGGAVLGVPGDWTVETFLEPVSVCPNTADVPTAFIAQDGFEEGRSCNLPMAGAMTVEATPLSTVPARWLEPQGDDRWQPTVTDSGVSGERLVRDEHGTVVAYRFPALDLWLQFGGPDRIATGPDRILATLAAADDSPRAEETRTGPQRPCPSSDNPRYDPVDFLVLDGRTYVSTGGVGDLAPGQVGVQIGHVVCRYSDVDHDAYGPPRHGDAATLDPDTPIFEIRSTDPGFRVAARTPDGLIVYEVNEAPDATVGADAYDIEGTVTRIEVLDWETRAVLAELDDRALVAGLVDDILASDVDNDPRPSGVGVAPRYRVRFILEVGPPLDLGLYPDDDIALPLLEVPGTFTDAILDSIRSGGSSNG